MVSGRAPGGRAAPAGAAVPPIVVGYAVIVVGCAGPLQTGSGPCELVHGPALLPPEVAESSGVEAAEWGPARGERTAGPEARTVRSARDPRDLPPLWTHNDAGWEPVLFAVDAGGRLLARVEVAGARNVDWEDLAAGPCREASRCLYIADTGDNLERRTDPVIYRVEEPKLDDVAAGPDVRTVGALAVTADPLPLRFPHGPRDVEALALLADGRALLISKGRNHPVEVYRTPVALADAPAGAPLALERIQTLTDRPPFLPGYVTGAASTVDGSLIAVRTYETLRLYRPDEEGRLKALEGGRGLANLRTLREPQGEGVAFLAGGRIVLTSEAGPGGRRGTMSVLACSGSRAHEREKISGRLER